MKRGGGKAYNLVMAVKTDDGVEYLKALADVQGVACASVTDGHVLIFKKWKLEEILKAIGEKDQAVVFVQRPEAKNQS